MSNGKSSLDSEERDGVGRGEVESVEARLCVRRVDEGAIVAFTNAADSHAGFNDSVVIIAI